MMLQLVRCQAGHYQSSTTMTTTANSIQSGSNIHVCKTLTLVVNTGSANDDRCACASPTIHSRVRLPSWAAGDVCWRRLPGGVSLRHFAALAGRENGAPL